MPFKPSSLSFVFDLIIFLSVTSSRSPTSVQAFHIEFLLLLFQQRVSYQYQTLPTNYSCFSLDNTLEKLVFPIEELLHRFTPKNNKNPSSFLLYKVILFFHLVQNILTCQEISMDSLSTPLYHCKDQ